MNNTDTIVTVVGIIYGLVLILATFVRTRFTESLRIDALFIRDASESTRPLNLIFGLLVAGYGTYSLFSR